MMGRGRDFFVSHARKTAAFSTKIKGFLLEKSNLNKNTPFISPFQKVKLLLFSSRAKKIKGRISSFSYFVLIKFLQFATFFIVLS